MNKLAERAAAGAGGLFSAVLGLTAGWIAYSALAVEHRLPLPPALGAERKTFAGRDGRVLSYYEDSTVSGRPLVLLHSINAAASAYEMRPLFDYYRTLRPVYALDWPGFGFSERGDRHYSPALYRDALISLVEARIGEAADVVALSLGSEFAARAALERVDLFRSLTLISPTGFNRREQRRGSQAAADEGRGAGMLRLLSLPLWSQALYDLLATRPSLRYFLAQSFSGPVDPGMLEYAYQTAHQPGARFAPLAFISGTLFTPDIRESVYEKLALPVLVLYDEDPYTNFETLPALLAGHMNWHAERITPTRGLPQFEAIEQTVQALDRFWQESFASSGPR